MFKTIALVAIFAYSLGQWAWAYPTIDGFSFGYAEFGYHFSYNDKESN